MKKKLCLYTVEFPYGKGETFLENELPFLSASFEEVHIFPFKKTEEIRTLPKNVKVHYLFSDYVPNQSNSKIFKRNFLSVIKVFIQEVRTGRVYKRKYREKLNYILSFFSQAMLLEEHLLESELLNAVHYTYWLDNWSTLLSLVGQKQKGLQYISRIHGYDLYEERPLIGFLHFRELQLKSVKKVFAVSQAGLDYLTEKYPRYKNKFALSYLGTTDSGLSPVGEGEIIRIVSCSNIIHLKRLHKIIESLLESKKDIEWIHFGDGPLLEELKVLSSKLPENVKVIFKGRKSNNEILTYYKSNAIDFFVNVSESEGLPVSIMEAISFGIPVIATNVGGTSEIVCEQTGWLLNENFTTKELTQAIEGNIVKSRDLVFRTGIRKYWENSFNADVNYVNFVDELN